MSWLLHNQSSEPRRQTDGVKGRVETLLVCVMSFPVFQTQRHHPSWLRFDEPQRDVYQRKEIFFTCALKWLRPCGESASQSRRVSGHFQAVSESSKTVSSFSQSLPGVWKPLQSKLPINVIDTWLLVQSQKQTHKTHGLTLARVISLEASTSSVAWLWALDLGFVVFRDDAYRKTNLFCWRIANMTWQEIKCRKYNCVTCYKKFHSIVSPTAQRLTELNHRQLLSRFILLWCHLIILENVCQCGQTYFQQLEIS